MDVAGKYAHSAKAATQITLRVLEPRGIDVDDLWQDLRHLAKHLAGIHDNIHIVRGLTSRQRLARFIVNRIPAPVSSPQSPLMIHLPIGRADLSDFLALRVESVSRAFTQFRREGILTYGRGQELTILRPNALAVIVQESAQKRATSDTSQETPAPIDLSGLPPDVAKAFLAQSKVETYRPNKIIFRQGDRASRCFVIVDGWMLLKRRRQNGKMMLLDVLTKGHSFAATNITNDGNYPISGAAASKRWAIVASILATAKFNGVEPFAYLKDALERLSDGHPMSRLDDLLPWNWTASLAAAA
jgi:CRP-like cAMP-binding protein